MDVGPRVGMRMRVGRVRVKVLEGLRVEVYNVDLALGCTACEQAFVGWVVGPGDGLFVGIRQ